MIATTTSTASPTRRARRRPSIHAFAFEQLPPHRLPFQPDMAVTAEIKTGRRSVISYLLSPLQRYVHDGIRER
jgi:hypothetical protein